MTPAGRILEFEVKFRPDGILEKEYMQRYIQHHPFVRIFMLSSEAPRIRILENTFQQEWHDEAKRLRELPDRQLRREYEKVFDAAPGANDLVEEIALARARGRAAFREMERDGGDLVIESGLYDITLESERLVYPKAVLEKYDLVVKEWLSETRG